MKKLLALLLVSIMVLSLCACANTNQEETKTDKEVVSSEETPKTENAEETIPKGETWEKSSETVVSGREAFATSKEEFQTNTEKLINKEEYELDEYENTIMYNLEYENQIDYNLDYVTKFYDGLQVTLPTTHEAMKNSGWSTEIADDFQISNQVSRGITYTNTNGESIILWTQNFDDSDEEKTIPLQDCDLFSLSLNIFMDITKKDETTGEYVHDYKKENTPDFMLCNGITQNSDIVDVINKLGKPSSITYYGDSDAITVRYMIRLENGYSHVTFQFSAAGNFMTSVKYDYSYADIK